MIRPSAGDRAAYVLLFAAPLFFVSNILVARAVGDTIPPVALAFWRWMVTLVFLVPYAGRDLVRSWRGLAREWPTLFMLGALGMGVCGAPVNLAAHTTTATNIGLIYASSPVLIVVFAWLIWREPISPRQAAGIVLCLLGVMDVITRGEPSVLFGLRFVLGDLLIVAASIAWALYSVLLKHRPTRQKTVVRLTGIIFAGVLVIAPFYALEIAAGYRTPVTLRMAGIVVFLALVTGFAAYLSYNWLVARLGPSRTGLTLYLGPLYNSALAYALLGEELHPYHFMAAVLVLSGLWLATFAPSEVAPAAAEG